MRFGDYTVNVWPRSESRSRALEDLRHELVLSRDLLAPNDGSLSRSRNAPVLTKQGTLVELTVPSASANPVLVFEGLTFESFQKGLSVREAAGFMLPADLTLLARFVSGSPGSLALARIAADAELGPTHCLVRLPRARWVHPGEATRFASSSLLVLGQVAVDICFFSTAELPRDSQVDDQCVFRLDDLEVHAAHVTTLHTLERPAATIGSLLIPNHEGPADVSALVGLARRLLTTARREYLFVPVWEDETWPRLAFLYRSAGMFGAVLSRGELSGWLTELQHALRDEPSQAAAVALASPGAGDSRVLPPKVLRHASESQQSFEMQSLEPPSPMAGGATLPSMPSVNSVVPIADVLPRAVAFGHIQTLHAEFGAQLGLLSAQIEHEHELGVLILGETGTGKGYLVQALHESSDRANKKLVTVNCASIPKDLLESELFGHQRGAFMGAQQRTGLVASADGCTLFLDEIGDAPMNVQLALLRLLDERVIRPVGADVDRKVNVRIVAATSAPLQAYIEAGAFKRDLYYRLAAVTIDIPPLRERRADLPEICAALLKGQPGSAPRLSEAAHAWVGRQAWLGNIRELQNALLGARAASANAETLQQHHFTGSVAPDSP